MPQPTRPCTGRRATPREVGMVAAVHIGRGFALWIASGAGWADLQWKMVAQDAVATWTSRRPVVTNMWLASALQPGHRTPHGRGTAAAEA